MAEELIVRGHEVLGVDSFSDYYSRALKLNNVSALRKTKRFRFARVDLASSNLSSLLADVDFVFHLAAQPGVRGSWGDSFSIYVRDNILATQRLLEAAKSSAVKRFIFASSSSIYGDAERLPTPESASPRPVSPYGVTKLAAEDLCHAYRRNHGVPSVVLRYFTVYGPRQRPDMAFSIFISRMLSGRELLVYGDGRQKRDFTFVGDIVAATMMASNARPGSVYNVGSGQPHSINNVISVLERLLGKKARVRLLPAQAGDVKSTCADIGKIARELGFSPSTSLASGLRSQLQDFKSCRL